MNFFLKASPAGRAAERCLGNAPLKWMFIDGLLIDTGSYSLGSESTHFFNENIIEQVALTHIHEDHSGMAAWLQENKNVPIYLHPDSIEEAAVEAEFVSYRLEFWGGRQAFIAKPMPEKIITSRYCFDVIDTPGHYPHHKAFLEKEKGWLFSGDLLVNIRPRSVFYEENMGEMIKSLQKIAELDFDTVFCAHTGILKNGRQLCQQKLSYLLELREEVMVLRKMGIDNTEIANRLFPGEDMANIVSGGDFSVNYLISTI